MTTLQKMTATAYAAATTDPGGSGTESDKKVSVGQIIAWRPDPHFPKLLTYKTSVSWSGRLAAGEA
jgi:hypothetical protein